jgi:hypothetical protein
MNILLGTELNANWFYVLMENAKETRKTIYSCDEEKLDFR